MKPVAFHREAIAELDTAIGYYEKRLPGLGVDLRKEVEAAVRKIQGRQHVGLLTADALGAS